MSIPHVVEALNEAIRAVYRAREQHLGINTYDADRQERLRAVYAELIALRDHFELPPKDNA